MRTKNVRRPSFRAHGSSIFSGRPTARDLARYGTETQDTFGYNTRSESPRGFGGGLDNARSGIAPKGRVGNGVPASQPTQDTATRPLAIQKNGTWYTYGWDLTKNICETYRTDGRIDLAYTYTPYGEVSPAHTYDQPLRWSSEYHDVELGLVYYNYRHYNPAVGRWMRMDPASDGSDIAKYGYIKNRPISHGDSLGLEDISIKNSCLKLRPEVISKGFWGYYRTSINNNDTLHVRNDFFIIVYPVWEDTCECNEERKQYYETLSYKITATFTYNSHDWRSSRTNSMFKTILGGIDKLELDWGTVLASGGYTNLYANSGGFGLMYHEIANKADAIIKLDKSPGGKIMDLHYRIIFDNDISRFAWNSHQISKS